jgi:hypothetical protein
MLPDVLYGCETWSLTLREGCRLGAFENRVLKEIYLDLKAGSKSKLEKIA